MKVREAEKLVKKAKIAEPETLAFFAAVMIFIGGQYDWDLDLIHKATGYGYDDVALILGNWFEQGVIVNGVMELEAKEDNELENIVEITLIALCGSGEVIRQKVKEEDMRLKFFNPKTKEWYYKDEKNNSNNMQKKTLNDHLFDTLQRLSEADETNIDVEANKAMHIISVSEQVLSVARLKLDILAAGEGAVDNFDEIDNNNQKQLGNGEQPDESKKK